MAEFLLEAYVPRSDPTVAEQASIAAEAAADRVRAAGATIRYVRSIFVPEDETCFLLFVADARDDVLEVARQAGLPVDRIVTAVTSSQVQEAPPVEA